MDMDQIPLFCDNCIYFFNRNFETLFLRNPSNIFMKINYEVGKCSKVMERTLK